MAIRMISIRRHLLKSDNKEYQKDDPFTVADAREADQLVRMGRARRAPTERSTPAPPTIAVPVVPPPAAARPQVQPMTTENAPALYDTDSRPVRQRHVRRERSSED